MNLDVQTNVSSGQNDGTRGFAICSNKNSLKKSAPSRNEK
jgi:hypothetical protein